MHQQTLHHAAWQPQQDLRLPALTFRAWLPLCDGLGKAAMPLGAQGLVPVHVVQLGAMAVLQLELWQQREQPPSMFPSLQCTKAGTERCLTADRQHYLSTSGVPPHCCVHAADHQQLVPPSPPPPLRGGCYAVTACSSLLYAFGSGYSLCPTGEQVTCSNSFWSNMKNQPIIGRTSPVVARGRQWTRRQPLTPSHWLREKKSTSSMRNALSVKNQLSPNSMLWVSCVVKGPSTSAMACCTAGTASLSLTRCTNRGATLV